MQERSDTMLMQLLYEISNHVQGINNLCDIPDLDLPTDAKKQIENIIAEAYTDYQAFIKTPMPQYNLHIKPQHGLEFASTEYIKGVGHNLYISDTLLKAPHRKEILYHEFTHIYDKEYLDKTYAYRMGDSKTHRYTPVHLEIHAEQVRFLYMLGCKTISDVPHNVTPHSIIYDLDGNQVEFYDYLHTIKERIIKEFVDKPSKNKRISDSALENMINKICYYIGALTVYQKYCDYKLDDVMDLSIISDFWNINIGTIIDFYCNHDIHRPTMKTIPKIKIADMGNILMFELPKKAREKYTILGDIKGKK